MNYSKKEGTHENAKGKTRNWRRYKEKSGREIAIITKNERKKNVNRRDYQKNSERVKNHQVKREKKKKNTVFNFFDPQSQYSIQYHWNIIMYYMFKVKAYMKEKSENEIESTT